MRTCVSIVFYARFQRIRPGIESLASRRSTRRSCGDSDQSGTRSSFPCQNQHEADEAPVSFYVEQAIQRGKPLYLGIGATRVDRNSYIDREAAERALEEIAAEYAQAIKTVSKALATNGQPRSGLAWPGDIYIEDINAETNLGLVKTIVETVTTYGKVSS